MKNLEKCEILKLLFIKKICFSPLHKFLERKKSKICRKLTKTSIFTSILCAGIRAHTICVTQGVKKWLTILNNHQYNVRGIK